MAWREGRLAGKNALLTGAAAGIGRATAEAFAREGARVYAVDLDVEGLETVDGVSWIAADVRSSSQMAAAVQSAESSGGLDICVANAGINEVGPFPEGDPEAWRRVIEVNLLGAMTTLQLAARAIVGHGRGGRLLATASIAGVRGEPKAPAYAASKGGVLALMRSLAVELAPHGITANSVVPGQVDTDLNRRDLEALTGLSGRALEQRRAESLARSVPAGRMARPEEVAAVFVFLASDEAAFISGESVRVDGGELSV